MGFTKKGEERWLNTAMRNKLPYFILVTKSVVHKNIKRHNLLITPCKGTSTSHQSALAFWTKYILNSLFCLAYIIHMIYPKETSDNACPVCLGVRSKDRLQTPLCDAGK